MSINLEKGVYCFSGKLDEHTDFSFLEKSQGTLRFNFRDLVSCNSNGIHKLLVFLLAHPAVEVEFHECVPEFISNVNVIPHLLGSPPRIERIKSLFVPYTCSSCEKTIDILFATNEIKQGPDGDLVAPERNCPACKNSLILDVDPSSYFFFLEDNQ